MQPALSTIFNDDLSQLMDPEGLHGHLWRL